MTPDSCLQENTAYDDKEEIPEVIISSPTGAAKKRHNSNYFKLPARKISLQRSISQSRADYLLRMLSKPEDYQETDIPNPEAEKRTPTGRKISQDASHRVSAQPRRHLLAPISESVSLSDRRHSDRQRDRQNTLYTDRCMSVRSRSSGQLDKL